MSPNRKEGKMKIRLKIGHKIGGGYLLMGLLLIVCGIAGFYGLGRLSASLDYLSGPAWDSADGSMEARIGILGQMDAFHQVIEDVDVETAMQAISDLEEEAQAALGRVDDAQLVDAGMIVALKQEYQTYGPALDAVLVSYAAFATARDAFEANVDRLVTLGEDMEEMADSAVEVLEQTPEMAITWDGELGDMWNAADGGMETYIGLLQQLYYLNQMVQGADLSESRAKIDKSLAFQEEAVTRMVATGAFDVPAGGAYPDKTMAQAYTELLKTHKNLLADYVTQFKSYQEAADAYEEKTEALVASLATLEAAGDAVVEQETENIKSTQQAANVAMTAALGIGLLSALVIGIVLTRSIVIPLGMVTDAATRIASGDVTQVIGHRSGDETGMLADAFRDMGNSLRAKAEAAAEIARGNLSVAVPVASDVDTLGNAMVTMKESIGAMAADVNGLIEAAVAGKLDARADPSRFEGQYRRIVQGVNDTLDAVIGPLNVAAEYVDRISKGDIPEPIADEYRGDFNEIKNNLNMCIGAVNGLVAEVDTLTRAAVAGQLDARGDPAQFHGAYARLVQGMNNTLDAVIGPLNVAGEYVDRISKGDIPEPITDEYRGDFNEIKNNLNMCIAAINGLVGEVNTLTRAAVEGRLEVRGDAALFSGDYARIVGGVNATIETLVGHLDTVPAPVVIMDDQFSMRYVNKAGAEVLGMSSEHLIGKKCYDCFKTLDCRTANCACARAMDSGLRESSETVARPNGQDLSIVYTGEPIKDREGQIIGALEVVVDQTEIRRMMDRLQETNESLQTTVSEYSTFAERVGRGDLTTKLSPNGHGQEDSPLAVLGHNLNGMVDNLRTMASQTAGATQALSTAATQILAATTEQATGASEQSAAISQATTTVDEIKTIAEQLVNRSQSVTDVAQRTVEVSRAGQGLVQETVAGMSQIKARVDVIEENILALSERTNQIGEIIDTVNSIAAQSNMLALNASVEAARAGEQGKGFAVVAEEVRDLAERSTQATAQVKAILSDIQKATNATGMATEEGKKGVDSGVQLVGQMGEAIDQLARVINESAQSAMQMSAGGQQQQSGMEQIAVAMQNINQVTVQSMTATRQAEKSAQQLNELAGNLAEIVEQFQL
jgi:PAS domain S-box-containing protein